MGFAGAAGAAGAVGAAEAWLPEPLERCPCPRDFAEEATSLATDAISAVARRATRVCSGDHVYSVWRTM